MKETQLTILIKAPTAIVWDALMDHRRYSNWNPFMKKVDRDFEQGKTVKIQVSIDPHTIAPYIEDPEVKKMMTEGSHHNTKSRHKYRVRSLMPQEYLELEAQTWIGGLLYYRYSFTLSPNNDHTEFTFYHFTGGLLSQIMPGNFHRAWFQGVSKAFCESLKDYLED